MNSFMRYSNISQMINIFVFRGDIFREYLYRRDFAVGGLCNGGSFSGENIHRGDFFWGDYLRGIIRMGGFFLGVFCNYRFLQQGNIARVNISGGIFPGGFCSEGIMQRGYFYRRDCSLGGFFPGELFPGGYSNGGVFTGGIL